MLWDLIRDFFVIHIFGGYNSLGDPYDCSLGGGDWYTTDTYITFDKITFSGQPISYSIGDYLSTTATIISISIIVVLCCLFIYKIIKLIGGLIR